MKNTDKQITAPRLWWVIARSHHALRLLAERSIANTGLCLSDFGALEALLHKGPLTITEIQDKVMLASGSMTAAIDRLEKMGLVVRKSTAKDRRARVVQLTPEGKRVAKASFKKHADDLEGLISVLSDQGEETAVRVAQETGIAGRGEAQWCVSAGPIINRGRALNLRSHKCKSA